jgi:hypothetical protein
MSEDTFHDKPFDLTSYVRDLCRDKMVDARGDRSYDEPLGDDERDDVYYHVSPAANRESIRAHGLDWTQMGAAPGIATGAHTPEEDGNYLARDMPEAEFFVELANHREFLDIWHVKPDGLPLVLRDGFTLCRVPIPADRLALFKMDADPVEARRVRDRL